MEGEFIKKGVIYRREIILNYLKAFSLNQPTLVPVRYLVR